MAKTELDIRQSETRILQDQLNLNAKQAMDSTLASINSECTPPGRLIAAATPSLVVSVNSGTVVNPNTLKNRVLPFVNNIPINFTGGTLTFPSGTGTITVSPGTNASITIGASQFVAVLVQLDSTAQLNLVVGAAAASLGAVVIPTGSASFLSLGYVIVQSSAGSVIQNITDAMLYQFVGGGGSGGSGGGGEIERDLDALSFRAVFCEEFTESATSASTGVDGSAVHTNASYNANGGHKPTGGGYYQLSYDASKTVTGSTTSMTLSGTPAFTVVAGDMLIVGTEARKIVTVTSQTVYVLESAFVVTPSPSAAAACVSQCVHTKDIYNLALGDNAIATAFPATTFSEIMVDYEDAPGASTVSDLDIAPAIGFTASPDGTAANYTLINLRPTLETTTLNSTLMPAAGSGLFLRFFANKTAGSGTVDMLRYEAWMQKFTPSGTGSGIGSSGAYGVFGQAYGFTNGVGTPVNCSFAVSGGKTVITLLNGLSYAVGVSPGLPYGSIDVYVNGQLLPRFINSTLTPDGSYTETSPTIITLDKDYSGINLAVEILERTSYVDTSSANISNISFLQEIDNIGFQGFVNVQSNLIFATTTVGTPATGFFYSTITGRGPLVDFSQDLKPRFGIERVTTQNLFVVQNEFGPNGEQVYGTPNDTYNQIRFVGMWKNGVDSFGSWVQQTLVNSYVEVTFYGTGLNMLTEGDAGSYDIRFSTDGGAESGNIAPSGVSGALNGRNYAANTVVPITSSLALGIHTVKIRWNASVNEDVYGFEIINQNVSAANISVNPGVGYANGQKLVLSSQSLFSNLAPVTGSKGGRVLIYQKSDGTIGQSFQATNASAAYNTSADHTNEEVVRTYSWREFTAGRSDDFGPSFINTSPLTAAFILEDGTTALQGSGVSTSTPAGLPEGIQFNTTGNFIAITFVGTGLDVGRYDFGATSDVTNIIVDGTSQGSLAAVGSANKLIVQKVCSGLPYGTHVVKLTRSAAVNGSQAVTKFIVYQPKTPALPSGAVQIGSYNSMATYAANSASGGIEYPATGVLRKSTTREVSLGGTWSIYNFDGTVGPSVTTSTGASFLEYTFFGTGINTVFSLGNTGVNQSYTIDGVSNLASLGASTTFISTNTGTITFSSATGVLSGTASGTPDNNTASITGLSLGVHKLRVTYTSAGSPTFDCLDIITPVHSVKANLYQDLQNTLPVGSNAISDDRQTTPIRNALPVTKAWAQAVGITAGPSTSATSPVPMPDMSLTLKTNGPRVKVTFLTEVSGATSSHNYALFVDGLQVNPVSVISPYSGNFQAVIHNVVSVSPGTHKYDIMWYVGGGTVSAESTNRQLIVEEM